MSSRGVKIVCPRPYSAQRTTHTPVVSIVIISATNLKHNGMYNLRVQP